MKHILTVFFAIIILITLCTNIYAAEAVNNSEQIIDSKVAEIIKVQLSHEERETIKNINDSLLDEPLLRIYNEIPWYLASKSPKEIIEETEKYNETATCADYYVLTDTPYRIRLLQGQIGKNDKIDTPQYIKDILALPNQIDINGEPSDVTGVYCFDAESSYFGILVCIFTKSESLIKYYDDSYSEAIPLSESDFNKYGSDYYAYLTSYENNYNEYGEPTGGNLVSFKDFINSGSVYNNAKNDVDDIKSGVMNNSVNLDDEEMSFFSKYGTIFLVVVLGMILVIGSLIVGYKVLH